MHTVELYEAAKRVAKQLGYQIREEQLQGVGGGACELAGKKVLFLDLDQPPADRLAVVAEVLDRDPGISAVGVPLEVAARFPSRSTHEPLV